MGLRRSLFLSAFLLAFSTLTLVAQTKTSMSSAEKGVRAADADWMKVFSAKDVDKSVAFCAEDGAVLASNAPIAQGRQAISQLFTGFFSLKNLKISWHADKASVARSGELGYTSGAYQMTFTDQNGKDKADKGKYVTVWKKQSDGSWKVMLDIFNSDLPAGS